MDLLIGVLLTSWFSLASAPPPAPRGASDEGPLPSGPPPGAALQEPPPSSAAPGSLPSAPVDDAIPQSFPPGSDQGPAFLPTPSPSPTTAPRARVSPPKSLSTYRPSDESEFESGLSNSGPIHAIWHFSRGKDNELRPNYVRNAARLSLFPIGHYQGVSLERDNQPPKAPKKMGQNPATITWVGFERGENSSRVFIQLSGRVENQMTREDGVIKITLPNTRINMKNNRRTLDTRYFQTPVSSVRLKRSGKNSVAIIRLRSKAMPQTRVVNDKNGYALLIVEFLDRK